MRAVEIKMEGRTCVKCGGPYRVMQQSPQKTCGNLCDEYGIPAHGERLRVYRSGEPKTEIVIVNVGKPSQPDRRSHFLARAGTWQTAKKNLKREESDMKNVKQKDAHEELNGPRQIESASSQLREIGMPEISFEPPPRSVPAEIDGTPPEPSDDLSEKLGKEGLVSISLLKESSNRLSRLMRECVKDSDLDRSDEGSQRVGLERVEMAIRCATAIAQNIQTEVNICKVLR
jgi:hypothetical protein